MGRRSFFFKDYVAHLILIVCAFALAGVVFCYQMSSYALHAKQTELRTTVQSLAEQSKLLEGTDSDVIRQIYMLSIARVAKEDELTVLITDADGNIEMGAKPDGTTYTLPGYHISNEVVAEMHKSGSYASVGSLGVLSESSFYTVGTCVKDDNGDADLMIFVSTQDPNSAGVVRHSTHARAHHVGDAGRYAGDFVHDLSACYASAQDDCRRRQGICGRQLRRACARGQPLLRD